MPSFHTHWLLHSAACNHDIAPDRLLCPAEAAEKFNCRCDHAIASDRLPVATITQFCTRGAAVSPTGLCQPHSALATVNPGESRRQARKQSPGPRERQRQWIRQVDVIVIVLVALVFSADKVVVSAPK